MFLWHGMILLGWCLIVTGFLMFARECYFWIRHGFWTTVTLSDFIVPVPRSGALETHRWDGMQGLHRIIDMVGSLPAALSLIVAGAICAWSGNDSLTRFEMARAKGFDKL